MAGSMAEGERARASGGPTKCARTPQKDADIDSLAFLASQLIGKVGGRDCGFGRQRTDQPGAPVGYKNGVRAALKLERPIQVLVKNDFRPSARNGCAAYVTPCENLGSPTVQP